WLTSGCCENHLSTSPFQRWQPERVGSGMSRTPLENGQLVCVTLYACQLFLRATKSSDGRQCEAWLSPITAIVAFASSFGAPNSQIWMSSWRSMTLQGWFGARRAAIGVGTTL